MKTISLCVAILLLSAPSSFAVLDGEEDKDNRFPYAVELRMEYAENGEARSAGCSAVAVSANLVITAAHCIQGPRSSLEYTGATVHYIDNVGKKRSVRASETHVDQRFFAAERKLIELYAQRRAWSAADKLIDGRADTDRGWLLEESRLKMSRSAVDLAVIFPSEPLAINQFPSMLWSFLSPDPFRRFRDEGKAPDVSNIEASLVLVGVSEFERGLGRGYVATAIGYGFNKCPSAKVSVEMSLEEFQSKCRGFGKRRFGKVRLATNEACFGGLLIYEHSNELGVDPWCVIRPPDGVDTTFGDSGGPIILETKLGDILLGVNSSITGGSSQSSNRVLVHSERGVFASLLHDLEFFGPLLKKAGYPIRRDVRR